MVVPQVINNEDSFLPCNHKRKSSGKRVEISGMNVSYDTFSFKEKMLPNKK